MEWDKKEVFIRKMKYYMAINDLNQKEVAEKIGVDSATICNYLKGKRMPKMDVVEKLAKLFKVQIHDLLHDDEKFEYEIKDKNIEVIVEMKLTNDEYTNLINYAKFLISQRKED